MMETAVSDTLRFVRNHISENSGVFKGGGS